MSPACSNWPGRAASPSRWSPASAPAGAIRWSRRFATKFANGLRQALLHDNCPDTACGLKAFRRDTFLRLPVFEGMHRFLPALFQTYGHPLICCPVNHRPRLAGVSKYTNFGRAVVGLADLLGVIWLRRRTRLPRRVVEE